MIRYNQIHFKGNGEGRFAEPLRDLLLFGKRFETDDVKESGNVFLEKRDPVSKGR
jgi:hypothetical protein